MCYWPGLLILLAVVAGVVALAVLKSPWFLVILLLGIPPLNNLHWFVAGFVNPLLFRTLHMDVVIEEGRIGYLFGADRQWVPLAEIARVERVGGVWAILISGGTGIDIPVSAIDEKYIAHIRAMSAAGRKAHGLRPATDRDDPIGTGNTLEERRGGMTCLAADAAKRD